VGVAPARGGAVKVAVRVGAAVCAGAVVAWVTGSGLVRLHPDSSRETNPTANIVTVADAFIASSDLNNTVGGASGGRVDEIENPVHFLFDCHNR